MIKDYKIKCEWNIQLIITNNFMSSKDSNEMHTIYTKMII